MPQRHVICGGTGAIGRRLDASLQAQGHETVIVSRARRSPAVGWDDLSTAIDGADSVINLAGSSVARPWTRRTLADIRDSRTGTSARVAEAIRQADRPPAVWIQASAVGYYGDRGDDPLGDDAAPGRGTLSDICRAWEAAATPVTGVRQVILRIGVVLQRDAGAWPVLRRLARLGVGGPVGNGQQWVPWIDIRDAITGIETTLNHRVEGPVNLVSPEPVSNARLMQEVRRSVDRRLGLGTPAFALRLGRRILGLPDEAVLHSQRAVPTKLLQLGMAFTHDHLDGPRVDPLQA